MNSIPSSKLAVLLALVVVASGTAAALSVSGTAPEPAAEGSEVSMNTSISQPFQDAPDRYTLRGTTELDNATFTIEVLNQGRLVTSETTGGPSFEQPLNIEDGATRVNVSVAGRTPALENFSYRNQSVENYTALRLERTSGGAATTIETYRSHRYTEASLAARQAIDNASAIITEDSSEQTRNRLNQAISAYNGTEFALAQELAGEAQGLAQEEQSGLPITLIGGAVLVLVLVVGAAVYLRSGGDDDYKLQ
jgi:hypothetical protein